ncbi:MAG: hypothetical protein HYY06_15460 [Deltaproteobacteria bacterium]|nr:hypothetical protein [Deltaproteobacteria bacterium]
MALAFGTAATPARADLTTLCKEHYLAARFDAARRCFTRALSQLEEQPAALCEAYTFIAATELGEEDPIAARRAIDVALAIDPSYDPADPLLGSPRVRELIDQARPEGESGRPSLVASDPDVGAEGAVLFSVRAQKVRPPLTVHLRYRFAAGGAPVSGWRQALLPDSGGPDAPRVAAIPRLDQARQIEYLFSVQTPEGAVVYRVGTQSTPLSYDLGAARRGGDPNSHPIRVTPWYGSWWFWTGLGAIAAGSVVVVLLTQGDDTGAIRIQVE